MDKERKVRAPLELRLKENSELLPQLDTEIEKLREQIHELTLVAEQD